MEIEFCIPFSDANNFLTFVRDKSRTSDNIEAVTYTTADQDGLYYYLTFDSDFPVEWYEETWKEFEAGTFYMGNPSPRKLVQLDSKLFAFVEQNLLQVKYGNNTSSSSEEEEWRSQVIEVVKNNFHFDVPFNIEFNSQADILKRRMPTVVLTPKKLWSNNGERSRVDSLQPLIFRNFNEPVFCPNWVNFARWYLVENLQDRDDAYIQTPLFLVVPNKKGIGNTVLVNGVLFAEDGQENLFSLLTKQTLWSALVALATEPFDKLKEEIENQITPLDLYLKMFAIQSKALVRRELEELEVRKNELNADINAYIRNITQCKVNAHNLELQIEEKKKALQNTALLKALRAEIQGAMALPFIENVEFVNNSIRFTTKPIQIDEGPVLGGYRISYDTSSKVLHIVNMVNPHEHLAHPHVSDGYPCLGNYTDIFYRFEIGSYTIGLVLLHTFLATYNPDDEWGRRLIYWDAKYVFEDMKERDILSKVENIYDDQYFEIYGEHLPNGNRCARCDELMEYCECERCSYCGELLDYCECELCERCDYPMEDCICERCPDCNQLWEEHYRDCSCERCSDCGQLIYTNSNLRCECERCTEDNELVTTHYPDEEPCISCDEDGCSNYSSPEEQTG